MENPETIALKAGWSKDEGVIMTLRMVSLSEEQAFMRQFSDLSDSPDREDKEYQAIVDALAGWSTEGIKNSKGELLEQEALPSTSVKNFFTGRTVHNERLANSVMLNFRNRLTPDVSFL